MAGTPGTLFVVATPIGNLEDVTIRALRVLREVDLIAAEDTRRTAKLLSHYEIRTPMVSVREHNEARETPKLLDRIERGERIALVSDAGTPGIADPGARLVGAAIARRLPVVPVPGPSALVAALSASGQPADQFVFLGFPPAGGSARREWLSRLALEPRTCVFYEAPHRIVRTVADVTSILGERPFIVFRELTKMFEEMVIGPIPSNLTVKDTGEFTIVVSASDTKGLDEVVDAEAVVNLFGQLTDTVALQDSDAADIVGKVHSIPSQVVRKIVKKHRIFVKQHNRQSP